MESAYEGSWVIPKGGKLTLDGNVQVTIEKRDLNIEEAVDLLKGWI